jgi:ectoine hydroxylase-related dioxygenase (phytanoyl-CoA dioxygenase family)
MRIDVSPQEIANMRLEPNTLQDAVDQIKIDGYVLLERVLPAELLAKLQSKFTEIFEEHVVRTGEDKQDVNAETKRGKNRFLMHLPFVEPFNDPLVVTNPMALQVLDVMLGKDYTCRYFATDTPLPGSDYQGVHSDDAPLFPDTDFILPPAALVLNIPLVDTTEENGPIDIFPGGSHRMPERLNEPKRIQELAATLEPKKVLMPAGSLLIRDLRMWHRGTPNRSKAARPNMALVYNRPWYTRDHVSPKINIPQEAYDALSDTGKSLFRLENITN